MRAEPDMLEWMERRLSPCSDLRASNIRCHGRLLETLNRQDKKEHLLGRPETSS
jgi:hypothetical protein